MNICAKYNANITKSTSKTRIRHESGNYRILHDLDQRFADGEDVDGHGSVYSWTLTHLRQQMVRSVPFDTHGGIKIKLVTYIEELRDPLF